MSKVDRVLFKKSSPSLARIERNSPELDEIVAKLKAKIQPGTGDGPEALGEIVTCSGEKTIDGTKVGINSVRWAVLAATGLGDEKRKVMPSELMAEAESSHDQSAREILQAGTQGDHRVPVNSGP